MPGVIIRTATRAGSTGASVPDTGRYLVVGLFDRGPVDGPALVRSVAELETVFGPRVPYSAAWDDLRTFFEEGGAEARVVRVVGPASTTGTVNVIDTAGAPTLRLDATSPGEWSAGVEVAVSPGYLPGTVRVTLTSGDVVEVFEQLPDPATAAAQINARSRLVRALTLGSPTPAPGDLMATTGDTPLTLSAGVDDRGSVTAAMMTDALDLLDASLGTGAVAIPGQPADLVGQDLIAHAQATRRVALLAPPPGTPEDGVAAIADKLIGPGAEVAALLYPHITVPVGGGVSKLIGPEGYVAACRARAHTQAGPWRAPAGAIAVARYVTGVERPITAAEGERLNESHVSVIRTILGTTRLYGWRSLSSDVTNYALLTGRDTLNAVAALAEQRLEAFVFQSIDTRGQLLSQVKASLIGIVEPYRAAGGLYERLNDAGVQVDPGYGVDVGPSVNTPASLASNKIAAHLALRVSPVGELIDLTITKSAIDAGVGADVTA